MVTAIVEVVKEVLKAPGTLPTNLRLLQGSFVVLVMALAIAFFMLLTQGHTAFNTSDYGITWGLPIVTYVFFVLTSTGLTLIASLSMVFRFEEFYPVAKRCLWLAIAALLAAFMTLGLEIGHPFRMLWALPTGMQVVSPMFWAGVFYPLYLLFLLLTFWRIHRGDWGSRVTRALAIATFVMVVVAHSTHGLLFGMMAMRPVWFTNLNPVYFLVTAALSGAAFAVFFTYLAYDFDAKKMPSSLRAVALESALPNIFATMIGITIMILVARAITGLWSNLDGLQVDEELVRSPTMQLGFWLGLVVPFVLMLVPTWQRVLRLQVAAAVLVILGLFIDRYAYIVGGQRQPMFKGSWIPGFIEYTPSFTEWLLTVIAIVLVLFLYTVGERLFKLSACPGWWK